MKSITPAELRTALLDDATQHFDERVPPNLVTLPIRELVIYLMARFACEAMLKYVFEEDK